MEHKNLIRDFILSNLVKEKSIITKLDDADDLIETDIIDSLGVMKLISFLEDKFSVQITDDEIVPENFESVQAISSFLQTKT